MIRKNKKDTDLRFLWDAIHRSKLTNVQICEILKCDQSEYRRLYARAYKKFGYEISEKHQKEPVTTKKIIRLKVESEEEERKPIVRQPAIYSNRSPYGIASPGMNFEG